MTTPLEGSTACAVRTENPWSDAPLHSKTSVLERLKTAPALPVEPGSFCFLTYRDKTSRFSERDVIPWKQVVHRLRTHPEATTKEDVSLFSLAELLPGQPRKAENVTRVFACVLDFDSGVAIEEATALLIGYEYLLYTTHSHTERAPRFRVVLPLASPVDASEWHETWERIARAFHVFDHVDKAPRHAAAMFYLPAHAPGMPYRTIHGEGAWLKPDDLPPLPDPEPRPTLVASDAGLSVDGVIERASSAKNAAKFTSLMAGDLCGKGSQSDADAALASLVCFYTQDDAVAEEVLRRSAAWTPQRERKKSRDYLQRTIAHARKNQTEAYSPPKPSPTRQRERDTSGRSKGRLQVVCLSDVEEEQTDWLWEPYIPLGEITILEGDGGKGKSFLTMEIASALTTGRPLPSQPGAKPDRVLFLTGEDDFGKTVKPRLRTCGADTDLFFASHAVSRDPESGEYVSYTLDDLQSLSQVMQEVKPRLLIIDPIQSFLGARVDMHRANEVRPLLAGLAGVARDHDCAVLIVRHLRKETTAKAAHRGMGSQDFFSAARSVLLLDEHPENPSERILAQSKNNLAKLGASRVFEVDEHGGFSWLGEAEITANELQSAKPKRDSDEKSAKHEAEDFLRSRLARGERLHSALKDEVDFSGNVLCSWRTVETAKKRLGVVSTKRGGVWYWSLPNPVEEIEPNPDRGMFERPNPFARE